MIHELFQHTDFLIVNKPEGLSCHNDSDSLLQRYGKTWHLVNRIDKETSGIVVITQKPDLQNSIQKALSEGKKTYLAVLRGVLLQEAQGQGGQWQEWTWAISDQGEGRDAPQGKPENQKEAKTLYRVVKSNSYFSLTECQILTGRQHQIRKHSRLSGRPIVGDARYGNPKDNKRVAKMYDFHRMALHAWKLEFQWNQESIQVEAQVPPEFDKLFASKI